MTLRVELKLRYLQHWIDELGRERYRFRRKGFPGVELPVNADPGSPEFQAAYHAALRGERQDQALAMVAARGGSGTVGSAIEQYLGSTTFRDSAQSTQDQRRPILKRFLQAGVGNLPLVSMDTKYIERWLETAPTTDAKRNWFSALKAFTKWATGPVDLIENNPCEDVAKVPGKKGEGHHPWTDEQIAQYCARHSLGTKARVAIELLLGVTLRRGDGISLGPQHVRNDWLAYTQEKNRKRNPSKVETPLPTALVAAIKACPPPPGSLTFLTNEHGRPFSKRAFNRAFRKWCDEAGLPKCCKPHGLRKGGMRIVAESGGTPHELMALSGQRTLKEVEHYTRAFDRKQAAARAQAKVAQAQAEAEAPSNVVTLPVANRS